MSGDTVIVQPTEYNLVVSPVVTEVLITAPGPQGPGIPVGGDTYALLQKDSPADGDASWTHTLQAIDKIAMNTAAGQVAGIGQMVWDDADGTLAIGLKGGNVTLQVGQESVQLVKSATNNGLLNGKAVYLVGSDGANLTALYAQANAEATSTKTFGIMTETSTGGGKAFCTTFGMVHDINTGALVEGAVVWLSPTVAGGLTTTKPTAPNHAVYVGVCVRSHSVNGAIFVNISNGYELEELHDVVISNPINSQVLTYDGTEWGNRYVPIVQVFSQGGTLEPTVGQSRLYLTRDGTLTHIRAGIGTPSVGADIVLWVKVNGIWRATVTISAGQHSAYFNASVPVHLDDYITIDVVSVGTTTAGADLTVLVTVE